jgi:CheY-like chemotaxis protein
MMPTVLIVDDEIDLRDLFAEFLQATGFEVLLAEDGEHAWEVLQFRKPDVILSDIKMPRLDGISLCERVWNNPQTAHIPVVLLSGNPPLNRPSNALDVLQKPVQFRTLISALDRALRYADEP